MVTRKETSTRKSRVKVGKLKLNKETVKDLTDREAKQIKGGVVTAGVNCNHAIAGANSRQCIVTAGANCD